MLPANEDRSPVRGVLTDTDLGITNTINLGKGEGRQTITDRQHGIVPRTVFAAEVPEPAVEHLSLIHI